MVDIIIVYDGLCPLCNAYVHYMRLKKAISSISLIDARNDKAQVIALKEHGLDINQGMVLIMGDNLYFGSDCIHMLALLSSRSGWFNKINATVFSNRHIAQWLYPVMRLGRSLVLTYRKIPLINVTTE